METFFALLAFVRGIHRSPVNSPYKGQWRGALMFSLIFAWIDGWVKNRETGDLRRHRAYYDVIVMSLKTYPGSQSIFFQGMYLLIVFLPNFKCGLAKPSLKLGHGCGLHSRVWCGCSYAVMPWDQCLFNVNKKYHYSAAIMGAMASQITRLTIVYSTVYSDADQRKHQTSASLAFVRGIHRWPVNSHTRASNAENVFTWWRHHDNFENDNPGRWIVICRSFSKATQTVNIPKTKWLNVWMHFMRQLKIRCDKVDVSLIHLIHLPLITWDHI